MREGKLEEKTVYGIKWIIADNHNWSYDFLSNVFEMQMLTGCG